ncbi:hypothetical protein D187_004318 [Cystobacter fuscus DSM 2262]|uniref:Uncharacterized protein n=1 Tax=Cystobacter fuscus (strain ATCC 25194 / DSM 2262 / NBRC 100088 / M29) TaxID=1242864 RepID=S9Q9L5_CYSF2|nr:hypothetical protein D187_004318 [Cystobacter fuscus DSM 2262]
MEGWEEVRGKRSLSRRAARSSYPCVGEEDAEFRGDDEVE